MRIKIIYAWLVIFAFLFLAVVGNSPVSAGPLQFEHVMNIGSAGTGDGQFQYIEDFAWDINGNLLVTDAINANVQVFDKSTGKFLGKFGGKDVLKKPEGIAVDKDGNIFVADYNTGEIKKFDRSYKLLKTFSKYGIKEGENMESEFMDIEHNLLYMAEAGNSRVDVFDLEGNYKFMFGGKGNAPGKMIRPEAAKADSQGRILVADLGNHRVQVFSKDGKFVKSWGKEGTGQGDFKKPAGLAVDKQGNIYVTEIGNNRVQVFGPDGKFTTMWGKAGKGTGEFDNLHGVIVDERGYVYVGDTGNNRVQVFKPVK